MAMERETWRKSVFLGVGESDFAWDFNFFLLAVIVCVCIQLWPFTNYLKVFISPFMTCTIPSMNSPN